MATKGDKARLYDVALRMYAEGQSLTEIEAALEESQPGSLNNVSLDAITKLGTLVQRWEQMEQASALKDGAHRAALFLDFVKDLIAFGGRHDAALVMIIEENFDDIIAWGQEKYGVGA